MHRVVNWIGVPVESTLTHWNLRPKYGVESRMSEKSLFSRIIDGEIPSDIVFDDDQCFAIRDINPQAPLHLLVIPREPIARLSDGETGHDKLLGHLLLTAAQLAKAEGHDDFRVVINDGAGAGQSVFHLHVHVLAGRSLGWPPG